MTQDSIERPLLQRWTQVCESLANDPGVAMVLGASDSGKTTWIGVAARQLVQAGKLPVAIVDADIGQSTVGPPTTIALTVLRENLAPNFRIDCLPCHGLFFVGSVSPSGHLLQILVGTKRLVDTAVQSGAGTVLVDTTGLIDQGPGFQLKLRKIELLAPRHLVAIQRGNELEPLLAVAAGRPGLRIHRLEAEQLIILAPPGGRLGAKMGSASPLLQPHMLRREDLVGLLIGLQDSANETIGLGICEDVGRDNRHISVRTPVAAASAIRILQLGNVYLDERGEMVAQREGNPL